MKKMGVMFGSIVLSILLIGFVSAAGAQDALKPIVQILSGAVNAIYEALKPLLVTVTGASSGSQEFFGKILGIIIVASIVYVVLSKSMSTFFDDHKWALWVICIAIPLLGFRFVGPDWITAMALPSSTFAIAVTAGLPFILYFYLIEGFPKSLRRIAWIFFGVIMLGLYTVRMDGASDSLTGALMIYPVTALIALIMAFADGTIRGWIFGLKVEKAKQGISGSRIGILQHALGRVHETYTSFVNNGNPQGYTGTTPGNVGALGYPAYKKDVNYYEKEINKLLN